MKKVFPFLFFLSALQVNAQISFSSGSLTLILDNKGFITALRKVQTGKNYLYTGAPSPLMTLVSNNIRLLPSSLSFNKISKIISLSYQPAGVAIDIKVVSKNTYLVMEIVKATPEKNIDAIVWGPVSTDITKTVGEVIGVVRDGEVAIGMQILNVKTLGGDYLDNEGSSPGRGASARPYSWGSTIEAYSINRNRERRVNAPVVAPGAQVIIIDCSSILT